MGIDITIYIDATLENSGPIGGHDMPRMTDKMLDSGDRFPHLELDQVGGGKLRLPDDLAGDWGVVLLYRGHW